MKLRASHPNHVWSYDFVLIRDAYGGKIRMLTMIDKFTRKCLTIQCARRIESIQMIEQLANAMFENGILEYIRSRTMARNLFHKSYEAGLQRLE